MTDTTCDAATQDCSGAENGVPDDSTGETTPDNGEGQVTDPDNNSGADGQE